jgi:hypothetical protein
MNMKWWYPFLWVGATVVGVVGWGTLADAQGGEIPCTQEIQSLCAGVQPGGGRILRCLKTNEARLSMACVQRLHDLEETMAGPLGACRDDWVTYCYHSHASTTRESIRQCLLTYQAEVSASCQKALQDTGSMRRERSRGMMP